MAHPEKNRVLFSAYLWLAEPMNKNCNDYIKRKFLDLYDKKTDMEWYSIDKYYRDKIDMLASHIRNNSLHKIKNTQYV